jgi:frataxin
MKLDESEFIQLAEKTLGRFLSAIEEVEPDDADADLQDGVLTIEFDDGRIFIVNRHVPLRQIWLSSPVSGAGHFDHQAGSWIASKDGRDLAATLAAELSDLMGAEVKIS